MKHPLRLTVFLVVAVAQLAVPASMIFGQERVLASGRAYQFKCRPVDPYDPFSGRYVALSFEEESAPVAPGTDVTQESKAYASLTADSEGWAHVTSLSSVPPETGDYLPVDVRYTNEGKAYFSLPFDRYYMNEYQAPAAESAYREHTRAGNVDAYVVVRVQDGVGVVEQLYVGGVPVEDYLRTVQPQQ